MASVKLQDIINACLKYDKDIFATTNDDNLEAININALNSLSDANDNELSFLSDNKQIKYIKTTKAKAVFLKQEHTEHLPKGAIALITNEPYVCLAIATSFFKYEHKVTTSNSNTIGKNTQIANNAFIGDGAIIGNNCVIYAGAFIGERVRIGDNCVIYPNVSIYHDCVIGNNVIIHSGSVIGSDGFGFAPTKKGVHIKIHQNGNVQIGNDVEIGANCAIDRAVFASTILQDMVKLDNLVHIAHNCTIKKGTCLAGQVGMAGGVSIGEYCSFGGQSALNSNVSVAPFSTIAGKSGVVSDITKSHNIWAGFPCESHITWKKKQIKLSKLLNKKD